MPVQHSRNGTAYEWFGDPENPVVVLIHGLGLRRQTWDGHLPELSRHFRILNYDLYGHGESAQPPHKPDLGMYARQLDDLLTECGVEKAALIGFSLGGMINRRYAMDHPKKTAALAILNSPHERTPEAQELVEKRAMDSDAGGPGATLDATIERWFTPDFIAEERATITRIRSWVLANDPKTYAQCRQVLANGVLELIRPEPPITHPTLVITCENDSGSTPDMSHAIGREIENSEVAIIPNLQHMGLVERPELFTDLIVRFLKDKSFMH